MDIIIIFNGLGNQMSQYAFYLQKKKICNSTYLVPFCKQHNGLEINKVFNINCNLSVSQKVLLFLFKLMLTKKLPIITKPLQKVFKTLSCRVINENFDYNFRSEYLVRSKGLTFYNGGWHSEKYFEVISDEVKKIFQFPEPLDSDNLSYIEEIHNTNSVSIHVRRGDFLDQENINLFGDVCNKDYFEMAINLISSKVSQPHFFIFSNDMGWVKTNLNISNVTYVSCNSGRDSWKDMYLMSLCKHNIISNSTFSWWGAWLNKNLERIVICPEKFLKNEIHSDVYPESWIKLSNY